MGLGGMSLWQLVIVLVLVVLLFGSKRLRGLGADLGETIKGFQRSVKDESKEGSKRVGLSGGE